MASEIRVDKINSLSGVGTVTLSPTGVDIAGITTAATLKATTGIVTTLTATTGIVTTLTTNTLTANSTTKVGSGITLSPDGDIFTTGITTFTNDVQFIGDSGISSITYDKSANQLNFVDNTRARFGSGADLSIYHDGSHSRIDETGTGNLMIQSDNAVFIKKGTSENIAVFNADGAVDLYHDNTKRLATTGNGADVFGSGTSNNYFKLINTSGTSNASHHMTIDTYNAANSYWNDLKIDASNIQLNTYTGNRATLSNTSLTFASGVDISMASGNGISFGATGNGSGTMTSELFDDYEEGTWTPTTPSGGNGWNSVSSAMYRKVGKIVFLTFYGGLASQSSTNALKIGGFPYAAAGSSHYSYLYGRVEGYTDSQGFWQAGAGTDAATFFYNNGLIGYNNFSANAYVLLSGFYFTG